jgi:hypothetical protein
MCARSGVIAVLAMILSSGAVLADSPARCDQYVKDALQAANAAQRNACPDQGPNNPRWSFDANVHRRWCLQANPDSVTDEYNKRHKFLGLCQTCRAYARAAKAAADDNIAFKCGFEKGYPARWSDNEDDHFRWCMGLDSDKTHMVGFIVTFEEINYAALNQESGERTRDIAECKGTQAKSDPLTAEPKKMGRAKPCQPVRKGGVVTIPCHVSPATRASSRGTGNSSSTRAAPSGAINPSVLGPGLLEGDGGFARQGPAGTGTPSAPTSGGRSLGGSTYSSPH